ncbi:MAG: vanadium-dependent haloperoxidase [Chloroflexi bacterium]|nr:MAG: vanadium-dependent haloperoxidase [Chloroflexota bacterium]
MQETNGEEEQLAGHIANYSKALPHDALGHVDPAAYAGLRRALSSGLPSDFERIPLGTAGGRRLTNPQAGLAFDLEGPDAQALAIPPAPRIDSAENSGEAAELYWMALLRDVHFSDYETNARVDRAVRDLNRLTDFRGPQTGSKVTPATLFRGFTEQDAAGPYVSQFLLRDVPYGTLLICQRQATVVADRDYLTSFDAWLRVQNGAVPAESPELDGERRYPRNLRDLASYVHRDALYEAYLNACLILVGMRAPLDPGNPYATSATQDGCGTFGGPHVLSLVAEVATRALKAVWYQKWFVHRRLRPEAFGGLVDNHLSRRATYPIDAEILNSKALDEVHGRYGSYLLPQAFPEGSPTHPAYGAGHAAVAGACVTILKAWFDESAPVAGPQVAGAAGRDRVRYAGVDRDSLTVGGELNKLAANIAIARSGAGIHWRSDYTESVELGEAVALGILEEQKATYNEPFYFSLTRFDGTSVRI